MNTRRSFFKTLGSIVVGCYLGVGLKKLEIPVAENKYNKLPFFFVEETYYYNSSLKTWSKLLEKTTWDSKLGSIMRPND